MTKKLILLVILALVLVTSVQANVPEWAQREYSSLKTQWGKLNQQALSLAWKIPADRNDIDIAFWNAWYKIKYPKTPTAKGEGFSEMFTVVGRVRKFYHEQLLNEVNILRQQADVGARIDTLIKQWPELHGKPIWECEPRRMSGRVESYRQGFRGYYEQKFSEIYNRQFSIQ